MSSSGGDSPRSRADSMIEHRILDLLLIFDLRCVVFKPVHNLLGFSRAEEVIEELSVVLGQHSRSGQLWHDGVRSGVVVLFLYVLNDKSFVLRRLTVAICLNFGRCVTIVRYA